MDGLAEQGAVDLLDEIVAELVEAVDGVLDLGDGGVSGIWIAGGVFLVPEVEVGAMLAYGQEVQRAGCLRQRGRGRDGG